MKLDLWGFGVADIGLMLAAIGVVAVLVYEYWGARKGPRKSKRDDDE